MTTAMGTHMDMVDMMATRSTTRRRVVDMGTVPMPTLASN
jgi:hypothetical protein